MKKNLLFSLHFILFIGLSLSYAQINVGGLPKSFSEKAINQNINFVKMPDVDIQKLIKEDKTEDVKKDKPWRFGQNINVDIDIKKSGSHYTLSDGSHIWRQGVESEGALTINLMFGMYNLPDGALLYVYNSEKTHVIGAFNDFNNQDDGIFATTLVRGDKIIIEYYEPANPEFSGKLVLNRVTHGYRSVEDYTKAFGSSGSCNMNVACADGDPWSDEIRSAAMLVSGSSGFCSGALVNNTSEDGTPYFLTADHCYSDPSSWVFWFNWQSETCSNPGGSPSHDDMSGATLRARNSDSDFCLVELSSTPPAEYEVYYAGWDNSDDQPTSQVGIHHPSGDIKKISFDDDPAVTSDYDPSPYLANSHWEVTQWDRSTTTEGGSSGSPLFDQNHRIIGQLHGGWASCSSLTEDFYGKFSMSWDRGGSSSNQLKNWLDPTNTGVTVLDGYDSNSPEVTFHVENGIPEDLLGAIVYIGGEELITDASGNAIINIPDGVYPYTVIAAGYDNGSGTVTVSGSNLTEEVVMLAGTPEWIVRFTVTDIDTGDPIEGANVNFNSENLLTNVDGEAVFYAVDGADIPYIVTMTNYDNSNGAITVAGTVVNEPVDMELTKYTVTFTVTENWGTNDPINLADISVTDEVTKSIWTAQTNASGVATIDLPIFNGYEYTVSGLGFLDGTGTFNVVDQAIPVNVALDEEIYNPYGLLLDVTDSDAAFSWNNSFSFYDGFEDGTFDAWSQFVQGSGTPGDGGTPYFHATNSTDDEAFEGSYVTKCDWGYSIDTWLITEPYTVVPGAALTFAWYSSYYWSVDPYDNCDLFVKVSTDGGSSWDVIWTFGESQYVSVWPWESFTWYESTIDLSSYVGQDVLVAFNEVANDNAVLQFDAVDISVSKHAIGTRKMSTTPKVAENLKSLPNDYSNVLKVNNNKVFQSYNVYLNDMVTPVATDITETTYDFTSLAGGDYTAGVESVYESGTSTIETIDFSITPTVTFHVTNDVPENIQDAVIIVNNEEIITDASGNASIYLEAGDYPYTITASGYSNSSGTVTVVNSDLTEEVELASGSPDWPVVFTVTNISSGNPIEGANVNFNSEDIVTIADGKAVFYTVDGTDIPYTVTMTNYADVTGSVTIAEASESVTVQMTSTVDLRDIAADKIRVYPNPSSGIVNILIKDAFKMEVIDITGKIIKVQKLESSSVIKLKDGFYFLRFSNKNGAFTYRVIVK